MRFTKQQIGFGALVAGVVLAGLFFVFVRHSTARPPGSLEDGQENQIVSSTSSAASGYAIEQVPIPPDILSQMPDPGRPIHFSSSTPPEVQKILSANAAELAAAIKENPNDAGSWLDLAIKYHTANDFDGARAIWEGLVKLMPKDTTAIGNLGRLYEFDLHDFPKAESYFLKAVAVSPNQIASYVELHELYAHSYKVGTGADIAIDKKALAAFPGNLGFLVALGDDYLAAGDTVNAKATYTEALDDARTAGDTARMDAIGNKLIQLQQSSS